MEHIIELNAIKTSGRPIGKIADDKLEAFLTEAEMLLVKPVIGDALYIKLTQRITDKEEKEKAYKLLDGGTYTTSSGKEIYFMGLTTAVSYYVYAKVVLCGDIESTRYGMVVKDDEYSTRLSQKERADIYHEALDIAHSYMAECKRYLIVVGLLDAKEVTGKQQTTGARIRRIG